MNAAQLQDWLKANPKAAAGIGAAGLVGVVLIRKRSASSSGGAATTSGGAGGGIALTPAGSTFSTGSQLQGVADSSASDAYNALQPQIEALNNQLQQQAQTSTIPVPAPPLASTLFAPSDSNNFVQYGRGGLIAQVQDDGSQLNLTNQQWQAIKGRQGVQLQQIGGKGGGAGTYDVMHNLQRVKSPATATA